MSPSTYKLLELPKFSDRRGDLTFVEGGRHVPFEIRRVFYLYSVPAGRMRAAHALKTCQQVIVAISGSFDVSVDDTVSKHHFHLDRSDCGLYVPPLVWREISNFSPDAVCLVLASEFFDEAEYLDDYPALLAAVRAEQR